MFGAVVVTGGSSGNDARVAKPIMKTFLANTLQPPDTLIAAADPDPADLSMTLSAIEMGPDSQRTGDYRREE